MTLLSKLIFFSRSLLYSLTEEELSILKESDLGGPKFVNVLNLVENVIDDLEVQGVQSDEGSLNFHSSDIIL